jgi:3'(2'), 5'-bisphosphate nucleotidase
VPGTSRHATGSAAGDASWTRDALALRDPLTELAAAAGRLILEIYRGDFAVHRKEDTSPVTEADLRSQELLAAGLSAAWPGVPMLAEEGEAVPYATRRHWRRFWSVDPLDGTREFVRRSGEFSVNVGLVERGRPLFGVIHAPLPATTYAGGPGLGAWRREGDGPWVEIRTAAPAGRALRVIASRQHTGRRTLGWLATLGDDWDVELVRRGSAVKACLVAAGSAHLYPRLGPSYEWDTAAAQAIVEGAGGVMRRAGSDEPLAYNKRDLLNPEFYAAWGPEAPHP